MYDSIGRKYKVDEYGNPKRRSKNWRPAEIPVEFWNKNPELKDVYRKMFPDARKIPLEERMGIADPGSDAFEEEDCDEIDDAELDGDPITPDGIAEGEFHSDNEENDELNPDPMED